MVPMMKCTSYTEREKRKQRQKKQASLHGTPSSLFLAILVYFYLTVSDNSLPTFTFGNLLLRLCLLHIFYSTNNATIQDDTNEKQTMIILFVAVVAEENNAYSDCINDKLSTPPRLELELFELLDDLPLPDLPLLVDDDPDLLEPDFPLPPLLRVLLLDVGRALGLKVASRCCSPSPPTLLLLLPRADGRLVARRDDDGTDVMVGFQVVPESVGSIVVGSIVVVVVARAIGDGVGGITTEEAIGDGVGGATTEEAIGDGVGRVPSKEVSGNELSTLVKICAVTMKE
jgi:hypothetical protein